MECVPAHLLKLPVGEARKLQRRRILVALTRKEVLPGRAIEDSKPEVTKETPISIGIEMTLKNPDAEETALPIPKGAKNENGKGQYLAQKGKSIPEGKPSDSQFNLPDFIPEASQDIPSSSEEPWRGLRRPKNPATKVNPKWDDHENWSGWNDWVEKRPRK